MDYFVDESSVVRKIWGKGDTVLFIFAGASAEFALNKAVDWLYYTGKLPSDPLGRLFSTIRYARKIVFSPLDEAHKAIDTLNLIHKSIEKNRGSSIPGWAYRDVLFMLVHYSIAAYELLERKLSDEEKEEVYNVFYRLGVRMGLEELPESYHKWRPARMAHMNENLQKSVYTNDLFRQYRKHLGPLRFKVLIEAQKLVVPGRVAELLHFKEYSLLSPAVPLYKISRRMKLDGLVKRILLPRDYKEQFRQLDV